MQKKIYIGMMPVWTGKRDTQSGIFLKAEIEGGKFSISGVVGPLASGNARGGCGQISDTIREALEKNEIIYAPEWSKGKLQELLKTWDRWHLNDMHAACDHQRAAGWEDQAREKVTIEEWRLLGAFSSEQKEIEEKALQALKDTGAASVSYDEQHILKLAYSAQTYNYEELPAEIRGFYTRDKKEEKTRGWISFEDHAIGILSKPCEVCGYKYGTEWRKVELPAEIVEYVAALPEPSKVPAWV